jgi:hypothetical protein
MKINLQSSLVDPATEYLESLEGTRIPQSLRQSNSANMDEATL